MTDKKVIGTLENEIACVKRAKSCDRDCRNCELVRPDVEIIEALETAIQSIRTMSLAKANVNILNGLMKGMIWK